MKRLLVLALGLLLIQQSALAANYDDEDDDDDEPVSHSVRRVEVPKTPLARYNARMETFKAQIEVKRDKCRLSSSMSLDFCTREVDQAELQGRHKIETQYKEELAQEAAGTAPAQ